MGCDVVGSAPYCDPDPNANINAVFDLAQEFNVPVDFHLDYHLEGKPSNLQYVIAETVRRSWQNKVCLGHMTYLSTLPFEELQSVAFSLKEANISVLSLPASDMCMMARNDNGNKRRGVCPVHHLHRMDVNASFATNNVQNLFTFTGDGDILKIGTLLCQVLQLTSESDAQLCLSMATEYSAKALGVNHGLKVGLPADYLLIDGCSSAMNTLAAPPVQRIVFKRGHLVSSTTVQRNLIL
jgi:cytosine deaminase